MSTFWGLVELPLQVKPFMASVSNDYKGVLVILKVSKARKQIYQFHAWGVGSVL